MKHEEIFDDIKRIHPDWDDIDVINEVIRIIREGEDGRSDNTPNSVSD